MRQDQDMEFTALHRLLGLPPGLLTVEILNEAVEQGVAEADDLDWKSERPPAKGITQTDFPKDIAAMANSGGGIIVYGVEEVQKVATGRRDVGEVDEVYERTLRSAAVTAISPPVFGLGVYVIGDPGDRSLAIVVPPSIDASTHRQATKVSMTRWTVPSVKRCGKLTGLQNWYATETRVLPIFQLIDRSSDSS